MKQALFLLPLLLCFQGCNESNAGSPPAQESGKDTLVSRVLHESSFNQYGDQTSKSTVIIRDIQSYENELAKRSDEYREPVNFETHTVLLVDMGRRNSGGYRIWVESVVAENNYVRAQVILSFPGENCVVAAAITNPYQFVEVSTTKDILLTEKIEIHDCPSS